MNSHKISVIIPVFNREPFIVSCIDSVLIQDEVDEILVIDDGSQDGSLHLLTQLSKRHPQIKLLVHPNNSNKGAAKSRNLGIVNAKNEFIAFLDSDDYYLPNRFAHVRDILEKDPTVDGIYDLTATEVLIDFGGEKKWVMQEKLCGITALIDPNELFFQISPMGNIGRFNTNGIVVRKTKLMEAGLYEEDMTIGEDLLLYFRLCIVAKLVAGGVNRPLAVRRTHSQNITNEAAGDFRSYLKIIFKKLFSWKSSHKKAAHQHVIIDKLLFFEPNGNKWLHLYLLLRYSLSTPTFMTTNFFVNNVKHILKTKN
jgi:glycosyltransferase involved in cell wall biosynthesis